MFQALFNSLSGLFSFSKSLNTVSNNVSNMNTPGFRGSDSFFANIGGEHGVRIADTGLRTKAGDLRQTGNATDLAINGNGFFLLRDPQGVIQYSRAGQFRFNEQGVLVDSVNAYTVLAYDANGTLAPIDVDTYRTIPAQATKGVHITGNLAPGSTTTTVNSVNVFDAAGVSHALSLEFVNKSATTPGSFGVTVKDETGATVGSGEVRFRTDGTPQAGFNTFDIKPTINGVEQTITLNFGTAGALDGMTSLSGMSSNPAAKVDDGHGALTATDLRFDENGVLRLTYSETEKREGPQIALAVFANEGALEMRGGRFVAAADGSTPDVGRAGQGRFGRVTGGSLEMSNVDLTQEFAEMIIIQRGYQASSRVMTVSNDMIEQLYNSTRGG